MPRLGAHLSISGGLPRAVDRAEASGCQALPGEFKNDNAESRFATATQRDEGFSHCCIGAGGL